MTSAFSLVLLNRPILLMTVLCIMSLGIKVCISVCGSCNSMLINNAVTVDKLGSYNGIAVSLVSLFRYTSAHFK